MKNAFLIVAMISGVAMAAEPEGVFFQNKTSKGWHLQIGPVMAPRVRTRISAPRPALPPPPANRQGTYGSAVPADPSEGFADRVYADGYVKPDEGTSDPNSIEPGLTWNWGADDVAGQYSNGKMYFHSAATRWEESVESSSYSRGTGYNSDRDILLGLEAMGGWTFYDDGKLDISIDGGFRYYGSGDISACSQYGVESTTTRTEYRYEDSYDASGWSSVPAGQYIGTPGGPGPVIGATPERSEQEFDRTYTTEGHHFLTGAKLDYKIWDLRLGPTFNWRVTDYLKIGAGGYGLLGLVRAKLRSDVYSNDGILHSSQTKCEPVFGIAGALNAQLNITENLFLLGAVEYDWWTDAVRLRTGGSDAKIKLSDMSVSLSVGIEF